MINKSNYLKLGIILVATLFLTLIVCNLYRNYDGNKANSSYIEKYVSTILYNELSSAVTELNSDSFIYLTYIGNKNIYNLEKKLKKIVKENDLEDNFVYVDASLNIDANFELDSFFKVNNNQNLLLPAIVYFKDGNPVDYIDSRDGLFDAGDFSQLIDKFELGDFNA